ncbi:hypothetical protein, partial [Vibrio cholerae]|uniref:hypothetical protein n=1 Tax=Vibrio cholerae TaxID=666 RepID=UPI001F24254B
HRIQNILFGVDDQEPILHTTVPSKQWASGSNEHNPTIHIKKKKKTRKSQGEVGGRVAQRPVGQPDNTWTANKKHS